MRGRWLAAQLSGAGEQTWGRGAHTPPWPSVLLCPSQVFLSVSFQECDDAWNAGLVTYMKEIVYSFFINVSPQIPQRHFPGLQHLNTFAQNFIPLISPSWCSSRVLQQQNLSSHSTHHPPALIRGPLLTLQWGFLFPCIKLSHGSSAPRPGS